MVGFLVSIVPSAGALFLFWLALRAIFQADRRERAAIARYDAERGSGAAPQGGPEAAAALDDDPAADEADEDSEEASDDGEGPPAGRGEGSARTGSGQRDGVEVPQSGL